MPPGAKKRKAAKKKQQQASSTQINLKSNHHESRSQEEESDDGVSSQENYKKAGLTEENAARIEKEPELDTDERIEITDSSHDHDKSSNSSSGSSSSDDESREVKKTGDSVFEVITLIKQDDPIAGDSTTPNDPKSEEKIEISHVETTISSETGQISLPKPTEITDKVPLADDEIMQASSSGDVKVKESEVVISREEEEVPVRPTHGVAQRTSWLSCCGLFDVVTGSSR